MRTSESEIPVHRTPPPKPPDDGGGSNAKKVSFREKLLGQREPLPRRERMDLIKKKNFRIDHEGGDRLKPKCFIDNEQFLLDLWKPWKDAMIVKLLAK